MPRAHVARYALACHAFNVRTTLSHVMCSAALEASSVDDLPKEFRLFRLGVNATSKGDFTLDAAGMQSIMSRYQREGVDLMVDLNHDSIDERACATRADAGDARGWFKLQARADGLYAVDVRWTSDGAERLLSKKQRYISPVFEHDAAGRVLSILNAALVSMPATYDAPALVAASKVAISKRVATYLAIVRNSKK